MAWEAKCVMGANELMPAQTRKVALVATVRDCLLSAKSVLKLSIAAKAQKIGEEER